MAMYKTAFKQKPYVNQNRRNTFSIFWDRSAASNIFPWHRILLCQAQKAM